MKIQEILLVEAKKVGDEWDETPETPEDPDKDKVPHIVIQLRKALDVNGDHPILFRDGTKQKLPVNVIQAFLQKYLKVKPADRETMQAQASSSLKGFRDALLGDYKPSKERSIYVK